MGDMKVVKACNDVNNKCGGRYKKYLVVVDNVTIVLVFVTPLYLL